jgi:hypothetical protein
MRAEDAARHGEDVAPLLRREIGGDERAALAWGNATARSSIGEPAPIAVVNS